MISRSTYIFLGVATAALGALAYIVSTDKTQAVGNDSATTDNSSSSPAVSNDNDSTYTETSVDYVSKIGSDFVNTIRGVRNNNPGNIKYNPANNWIGQTGQDANGFSTFDTEANGIRAIGVLLKNYQSKHGLNTVDALIRRWSTTDQDAYVSNVAAYLGVDPYESINTQDEPTLVSLIQAIISQEDGSIAEFALNTSGAIDTGAKNA